MYIDRTKLIRLSRHSAMIGGFALLLLEIRFEHRAVLIDDWRPWVPIFFCCAMILIVPMAELFWERGGKKLLIRAYGLTICLGALGLVFHSEGHLMERMLELLSVWTSNLLTGASLKVNHPPLLAPCAFMGLGAIGILFCFDSAPAANIAVRAKQQCERIEI